MNKRVTLILIIVLISIISVLTISCGESAESHNRQGVKLLQENKYEKAIAEFAKALELQPNNFDAYYYRGYAYFEISQYDVAISDFNKSINLDPKDEWSYYWRGSSHWWIGEITENKGEKTKAVADLEKFIELSDDDYFRGEKPIDFLVTQTRDWIEEIKTELNSP